MPEFRQMLADYTAMVDTRLLELVPGVGNAAQRAMAYSLHAGGKRIRPVLALEFCRVCGGDLRDALDIACAIEMVHTYSLIHDDLPCMDDDHLRRGKPACHVAFGEAIALLAGDGLLNGAVEVALNCALTQHHSGVERALKAAHELFEASGVGGMIAGQVADMELSGKTAGLPDIERMDRLKTGKLIVAAARAGVLLAGGDDAMLRAAGDYAGGIGLAFQIRDDLLDREGDAAALGKRTGMDAQRGKTGYVELLGAQGARVMCARLTEGAKNALATLPDSGMLGELADYLLKRDH